MGSTPTPTREKEGRPVSRAVSPTCLVRPPQWPGPSLIFGPSVGLMPSLPLGILLDLLRPPTPEPVPSLFGPGWASPGPAQNVAVSPQHIPRPPLVARSQPRLQVFQQTLSDLLSRVPPDPPSPSTGPVRFPLRGRVSARHAPDPSPPPPQPPLRASLGLSPTSPLGILPIPPSPPTCQARLLSGNGHLLAISRI